MTSPYGNGQANLGFLFRAFGFAPLTGGESPTGSTTGLGLSSRSSSSVMACLLAPSGTTTNTGGACSGLIWLKGVIGRGRRRGGYLAGKQRVIVLWRGSSWKPSAS